MTTKSKLALALVIAMGIASPAFAQMRTGTAANTYGWNSPQANRIGAVSGRHLYDMVPQARVGSNASSLTGGGSGSSGYDANIATDF